MGVQVIIKLAIRYRFSLPPFYTLIVRSLGSLEGIALRVDPSFSIVSAAIPILLRRMLTDTRKGSVQLLRELLLEDDARLRVGMLEGLLKNYSAEAGQAMQQSPAAGVVLKGTAAEVRNFLNLGLNLHLVVVDESSLPCLHVATLALHVRAVLYLSSQVKASKRNLSACERAAAGYHINCGQYWNLHGVQKALHGSEQQDQAAPNGRDKPGQSQISTLQVEEERGYGIQAARVAGIQLVQHVEDGSELAGSSNGTGRSYKGAGTRQGRDAAVCVVGDVPPDTAGVDQAIERARRGDSSAASNGGSIGSGAAHSNGAGRSSGGSQPASMQGGMAAGSAGGWGRENADHAGQHEAEVAVATSDVATTVAMDTDTEDEFAERAATARGELCARLSSHKAVKQIDKGYMELHVFCMKEHEVCCRGCCMLMTLESVVQQTLAASVDHSRLRAADVVTGPSPQKREIGAPQDASEPVSLEMQVLTMALSAKAAGVRRVLLEADTKV